MKIMTTHTKKKPYRGVNQLLLNSFHHPYKITQQGTEAYSLPVTDQVNMPPIDYFTSPEACYGTLFH
jgi:antirestriction protein ArdC